MRSHESGMKSPSADIAQLTLQFLDGFAPCFDRFTLTIS